MLEKYKLYSYTLFGLFWLCAASNFIGYELFGTFALLKTMMLFFDGAVLIMGLTMLRNWRDIAVIGSFIVISAFSSLVLNHEGLITYFNGFRNYIGLLFCMPVVRYLTERDDWRTRFIASFDRQLYIFIILQAVALTYQFIRWGANDHGGGLFSMGYSGVTSMLQYVISFYLVSKHWDIAKGYGQNLKDNLMYIWPLYGTLLNETKASFLYIALYFLLLYRWNLMSVLRFILSIPVVLCLFFGVFMAYLTATGQSLDRLTSGSFYENYLVGEDPQHLIDLAIRIQDADLETDNLWVVDLPRFTKLMLIDELLDYAGGGDAFGAGLGQFKGGTTLELTPFAKSQQWALQGSRPFLFDIMIELGWAGFFWVIAMFAIQFQFGTNPYYGSLRIKLLMTGMTIFLMVYNDTLFFIMLPLVMFYTSHSLSLPPIDDGRIKSVFGDRFLNSSHL